MKLDTFFLAGHLILEPPPGFMSISYKIDTERKTIFISLEGELNDEQIRVHHDAMRSDPAFSASFCRLVDCSGSTGGEVSTSAIQRAALRVKGDVGRKTAIFAPQDMSFGMSKMFEAMTSDSEGETKVFRDLTEARQWLGIE